MGRASMTRLLIQMITTVCVAILLLPGIHAFCVSVEIVHVYYQKPRDGVYKLLPTSEWCTTDRPTYFKSGASPNYLYYLTTDDGWAGWMVGSDKCQNRGGIAAESSAYAPQDVEKGTWEEVYVGSWYYSFNLEVKCRGPLTTGAIVGIIFATILLLGAIIVIIVCCCSKNNTKHRSTVTASSRTTSTGAGRQGRAPTQARPPIATISHSTATMGAQVEPSMAGGAARLPPDFVHMAAPPPYEAEYKSLPPPTYTELYSGGAGFVQVHGASAIANPHPSHSSTMTPIDGTSITSTQVPAQQNWQQNINSARDQHPGELQGQGQGQGQNPPPGYQAPANVSNVFHNRAFDITE